MWSIASLRLGSSGEVDFGGLYVTTILLGRIESGPSSDSRDVKKRAIFGK